jgi:hypothetical protein
MPASTQAPAAAMAPPPTMAPPPPAVAPPPPRFAEDRDGDRPRRDEFRGVSDRELRDRLSRLDDESRQLERERRAVERELDRRGVRY